MKLGKGNNLQQMATNPQQIMKKIQGIMDPRMLQQMGGTGNLMNMMKEI